MKISQSEELFVFFSMIISGFLEGLNFDTFSVLGDFFKKRRFLKNLLDFFCWIFAGVIFLNFILFLTNGEIRFFMILGLFLGVYFYYFLLSKPLKRLIFCFFSIFFDFFQIILKILLTPAHFLYKIIIRYIIGYLFVICRKIKDKIIFKNFRIQKLRIKNDKKKEQK